MVGSKSSDPDGDKLSFTWTQKDGPDAKLSDKEDTSSSFVAPNVDKVTEMTFELTVEDTNGTKSLDDVKISITPPDADEEQADADKDTGNDRDSSNEGSKGANDNNDDGNSGKEEDSGSKEEGENKSDSGSVDSKE